MGNKTVTVKPSGGTYTTLQGAITGELAANADLTAMAGILTISIEGDWSGGADSTAVFVNGFTTSTDYYIKVTTDAANRAKASGYDTTRYIIETNGGAEAGQIRIQDQNVWIDGLQVHNAATAADYTPCIQVDSIAAGGQVRISNCRLRQAGNVSYKEEGVLVNDTDTNLVVWNTIMYGFGGRTSNDNAGLWLNCATANIYNCTIYGAYAGVYKVAGTINVYNSPVFNNGDDFVGSPDVIDFCASDDNDTTGTNVAESGGGASWTDDFNGAATGDFSLKATTNLVGATTDKSSGLFTNDMDGTTRGVAWDVGAHEYLAAGGGSIVPIMMQFYRRLRD